MSKGEPSSFDKTPPASFKIRLAAAVSQGFKPSSQKPSKRPQAKKQRSTVAAPALQTP
jgi:hypothetical protein